MALIGAASLADALQCHPEGHTTAFREYEDWIRPFVEQVEERAATDGMATRFPADEAELEERNRKLLAGEVDI